MPNVRQADVILVGGGHNGLVAAIVLAQRGLQVRLLEARDAVGGAVRTEYPYAAAPNLPASTGAYLLGLMPPKLMRQLDLRLPLIRRDPHYFLPTTQLGKYLLLGGDEAANHASFLNYGTERDWVANQALQAELTDLRDDITPTWLLPPCSIEETAERFVREELREVFVNLCRRPVGEYLERFGFVTDHIKAMYAVTDGFSGLDGGWDTPGTGMNFLVHNMCSLPRSGGTWMCVAGGMGTVTKALVEIAREHGVEIDVASPVAEVQVEEGVVRGVLLRDGRQLRASTVVVNADPFVMRDLVGRERLPEDYNARVDGFRRDGTTLKVNLALRDLPKFSCLPEPRGQHGTTIHLLPEGPGVIDAIRRAYDETKRGELPEFPLIEWYLQSPLDESMRDDAGRHSAALFVQWVPYQPKNSTWDQKLSGYVQHLLSICDRFAPGTTALVDDVLALPPPAIEARFGMTRGHIHHVDNGFGFADRLPYATPIGGLYSASAGCHPAGSVIGAAGHNAAQQILRDLGHTADNG